MPPAGEVTDVAALFGEHHDRIYRYILHMVRNPADAEDLTQDTFLRAYRRRDSLRDLLAVRGWLYRIATHVCLDRLRQRQRNVSLDGEEGARAHAAVSQAPSVLQIIESAETSACVQHCLDYLPDHYRAVILLYEAHSLTAPEIAQLLGLSVSTVKIRLHRARRKLQEIMGYGCSVSQDARGLPICQPKSSAADNKRS